MSKLKAETHLLRWEEVGRSWFNGTKNKRLYFDKHGYQKCLPTSEGNHSRPLPSFCQNCFLEKLKNQMTKCTIVLFFVITINSNTMFYLKMSLFPCCSWRTSFPDTEIRVDNVSLSVLQKCGGISFWPQGSSAVLWTSISLPIVLVISRCLQVFPFNFCSRTLIMMHLALSCMNDISHFNHVQLCNLVDCSLQTLLSEIFPGKNTGVGCCSLL